jgi:hypothetical protein
MKTLLRRYESTIKTNKAASATNAQTASRHKCIHGKDMHHAI